jgi:hypothetical protein
MIQLRPAFQHFQLDIAAQRAKHMIDLRGDRVRRRLLQRGVLLQRFVIRFHVPSCAIDSGHGVRPEGGITGHQILHAAAPIFVYEDLLDQHEWEVNPFEIW